MRFYSLVGLILSTLLGASVYYSLRARTMQEVFDPVCTMQHIATFSLLFLGAAALPWMLLTNGWCEWRRARDQALHRRGLCVHCRYPVPFEDTICPECGQSDRVGSYISSFRPAACVAAFALSVVTGECAASYEEARFKADALQWRSSARFDADFNRPRLFPADELYLNMDKSGQMTVNRRGRSRTRRS